jgi:replicative DNA helicase
MTDWLPERLPEDLDAERSLLATCCAPGMSDIAREVVFRLSEADFVHPSHKEIYRALVKLLESDLEVGPIMLKNAMDQKALERIGDLVGIGDVLMSDQVGDPNLLADILIKKRKHRDLIHLGSRLARQAAEEETDPESLVEEAAIDLYRIAQGQDRRGLQHIEQVFEETYQELEDRLYGRGASGQRVGFGRLDDLTQGFQPGNLIVLAARPSLGKTSLSLNWLWLAARKYNAHAAFFSLEMSREEVRDRLIAAHAQLDLKTVARGQITEAIHEEWIRARNELAQLPIYICDKAAITVREIAALIDKQNSTQGSQLDIVIIDYLQLISSPQDSRASRQTEAVRIGEISRSLKIMAKERNIPVVVLSQLNREIEHRQTGRPQLSDLRDSGAIEQDADMVMFIHKKIVKGMEDDPQYSNRIELLIAKHRNGPTGMVPLAFIPEYTLFREMEPGYDE